MDEKIVYIKMDNNVILNENCIKWVRKIDECLMICARNNGCSNIDTHKVCKNISYDSYIKLNKHFDKVKNYND